MKKGAIGPFLIINNLNNWTQLMKLSDIHPLKEQHPAQQAQPQPRNIKSATGNKITTYFETSQGSKYLLTDAGESKRIKSLHANSGPSDVGVKAWFQHCIFIPQEFKYEGNSPQFMMDRVGGLDKIAVSLKGNNGAFYKRVGDKWEVCTWDDAYPKSNQGKKPLMFKFSHKPVIGYHVAEYNLNGQTLSNYHFGSEVSEIKPIDELSTDDIMQFADKKKGA